MDVLEAIYNRQSIGSVLPDDIPRQVIEGLLSAAVQAPNHHKVRPWRFIVIQGKGRLKIGEVMAQSLQTRVPEATPGAVQKERERLLRAPVVIAVGVDHPEDPRVDEIENVCAAAAAVQNLLLAARSHGLGATLTIWHLFREADFRRLLAVPDEYGLYALVPVGYPMGRFGPVRRRPVADVLHWDRWT